MLLIERRFNMQERAKKRTTLLKRALCILAAAVIMMGTATSCAGSKKSLPDEKALDKLLAGKQKIDVSIKTDKGEIVAELRPDLMPITVRNFMKLVEMRFYDGLTFHRVESWVIQGGDPEGTGTGGPGWSIKLETNPQLTNIKYCIAMARSTAPDTAGSQFYILKQDVPQLNGKYAVFGNIIKGQDVVDKIAIGDKIKSMRIIK
jgi:cyclophilin family peptidyl-prolyl cis-trans isomerase